MLTDPVSHSSPLVSSHPETEQNLQRQLQEAAIREKGTAIPILINMGTLIAAIVTNLASGKEDARLVIVGGFCVNALWNVGVRIYNGVKQDLVTEEIQQVRRLQAAQQRSVILSREATSTDASTAPSSAPNSVGSANEDK